MRDRRTYRFSAYAIMLAVLCAGPALAEDAHLPTPPEEGREAVTVEEIGPEEVGVGEAGEDVPGKDEGKAPQEKSPSLEPLFVRELTGVGRGRNDSNPLWSPSGNMLAFERTIRDKKEVIITSPDGTILHKVYYKHSEEKGDFDFFLPGLMSNSSYNAGISWAPTEDRFVFMSNGGTGNYDLYLSGLGNHNTTRLTMHREKDGHSHWSPVSEQLVFISGRGGKADVYLMDLLSGGVKRITEGEKLYLYPQWSPDGGKIAMIYGSNENHDIYLIEDVTRPLATIRPLTTWGYDDLRPIWSPDGRKLAFYSNYNKYNDPRVWSIIVIAADGSDYREGEGLAANVVATDVVPDIERGPAWMPDSRRIVYVKDDRHAYNPIHVAEIDKKSNLHLKTGTKINHDVVCSAGGAIAFRAQVEQWDRIFVTRLKK